MLMDLNGLWVTTEWIGQDYKMIDCVPVCLIIDSFMWYNILYCVKHTVKL